MNINLVPLQTTQRRKAIRFNLELLLCITRVGVERVALEALTKNVSSAGVLFLLDEELDIGARMEYLIELPGSGSEPNRLHCLGKVMRVMPALRHPNKYEIAATLERYEFEPFADALNPYGQVHSIGA